MYCRLSPKVSCCVVKSYDPESHLIWDPVLLQPVVQRTRGRKVLTQIETTDKTFY